MREQQRTYPKGRAVAIMAGLAAAVLGSPQAAYADPTAGAKSTPGTLTCPDVGLAQITTSGSPAARAIQIVGTDQVFVFKGSPDLGFFQGVGSSSKWITCTLDEPGPGGVGTLTVVGILTPVPH